MKTTNPFYTLTMTALLLFVSFAVQGQQTVEKTLVKSFNLQGAQTVALNVNAPVEIRKYDGDLLRVQLKISLENGSEALLKSLVRAGRYNLRQDAAQEDAYTIVAPDLDLEVKIGGKPLADQVSLVVFHPENVAVQIPQQEEEEVAEASSSL